MQKARDRKPRTTGSHVKNPAHLSRRWKNAQLMRIDEVYADQVYKEPKYIKILASVPSVRIRYHAVSITSKRIRYNYILVGHDKDFIETWDEEARYDSLSAGEYTFRVKVAGEDPGYSEKPAELKLEVVPDPRDRVISELEKKVRERTKEITKANEELQIEIAKRRHAEEILQHQLELQKQIGRELGEKTEELSRSNKNLDAFVYTVSHDLKAPLVSLQGFSTLLLNNYGESLDENGKMYIDRIMKNSEHMGKLVQDLLEISRIGRIMGPKEQANISDLISDIADELAPQLQKRGTKLTTKGEMPVMWCELTRIRRVFTNLISNSNKFMGDGNENPAIEVGYCDGDNYHKFYVKDNGIGIDEKYHDKIFHIFQRLDDIKTEGTGVGLAIVKKIIESFGGSIRVDSAEGKGTTIHFTLPKSDEAGKPDI